MFRIILIISATFIFIGAMYIASIVITPKWIVWAFIIVYMTVICVALDKGGNYGRRP